MRPVALDLFGDLDTRRAAHWFCAGSPDGRGFDTLRMQTALARLARRPDVLGWVAGGGFEDCPDLMQACAQALPLIGNEWKTIDALKAPGTFFPMLDELGIGYPPTQLSPPSSPAGWLSKRVGATGGGHVRRLEPAPRRERQPAAISSLLAATSSKLPRTAPVTRFYQREASGAPMSLLFIADGRRMRPVGWNRLLVGAVGRRPFVFHGAVGPVTLTREAEAAATRAAAQITRRAGLAGLNSMDFLLDGEAVSVLEINPRPSATIALHDVSFAGGLLKAHLDACTRRFLPPEAQARQVPVRGFRIAYARRQLMAGSAGRRHLKELGWCHDIGPIGALTDVGGPLCTVSAEGSCSQEVTDRLAQRVLEARRIHEDDDGS